MGSMYRQLARCCCVLCGDVTVSGVTCAFLAWLATYLTVQGKRAVVKPAPALSTAELMQRICAYYPCELADAIAQPDC